MNGDQSTAPLQREAAPAAGTAPVPQRRLSDKVLIAFEQACDTHDLEMAEKLLSVLERLVTRGPRPGTAERRIKMDCLVSAFDRLWRLKHPGEE